MAVQALQKAMPTKPKTMRPVSETRKIRKPLMERKRRERINHSLEQLALLLKEAKLVAQDKPLAKLEKADILELTVQHLQCVRQRSGEVKMDSGDKSLKVNTYDTEKAEGATGLDKTSTITTVIEQKPILLVKPNTSCENGPNSLQPGTSSTTNSVGVERDLKKTGVEVVLDVQFDKTEDEIATREKSYAEGFQKCLGEVQEAVRQSGDLRDVRDRLMKHLESCLQSLPCKTYLQTDEGKAKGIKRQMSANSDCRVNFDKKKRVKVVDELPQTQVKDGSTPHTGLTLVPMRLPDGVVAFLVQGDTQLLLPEQSNISTVTAAQYVKTEKYALAKTSHVPSCLNTKESITSSTPVAKTHQNKVPILSNHRSSGVNFKGNDISHKTVPSSVLCSKLKRTSIANASMPNSAFYQGSPYSIRISDNVCITGPQQTMPKIRTVTLPVGTVASTLPSATKETPLIQSLPLQSVTLQSSGLVFSSLPPCNQLSASSVVAKSNDSVKQNRGFGTRHVNIVASPMVSTSKELQPTYNENTSVPISSNSIISISIPESFHPNPLSPSSHVYVQSPILTQKHPFSITHVQVATPNNISTMPSTFPLSVTSVSPTQPISSSTLSAGSVIDAQASTGCESAFQSYGPCTTVAYVTPSLPVSDVEPTSIPTGAKMSSTPVMIFPPTPPPSVDQWFPASPSYEVTPSSCFAQPRYSSASPGTIISSPPSNSTYLSTSVKMYPPSSTMSLLSTSVNLLNVPSYCPRSPQELDDEEEFIDVENVTKDDPTQNAIRDHPKFLECGEKSSRLKIDAESSDMWRPW